MMTMSLRLIVGLGNPGKEYESTRHNVGFWLVHALLSAYDPKLRWSVSDRFFARLARFVVFGRECIFLLPQTFMNCSGRSVSACARFYKIAPSEMLVVHDDLDLHPGDIRFKLGGGAGGHNGLKSIDSSIGSRDYWRLRLGIGHPGNRDLVTDWVLSRPNNADKLNIEKAIEHIVFERDHLLADSADVNKIVQQLRA